MKAWLLAVLVLGAGPALAEVKPLPVPVITLYPGDAITTGAIDFKEFHITADTPDRFAMGLPQLQGRTAKRTLLAGKPIALANIKGTDVVRKGVPTHAILRDGALAIDLLVEPLEDGAVGDVVRARNPDSKQEIRLRVRDNGELELVR